MMNTLTTRVCKNWLAKRCGLPISAVSLFIKRLTRESVMENTWEVKLYVNCELAKLALQQLVLGASLHLRAVENKNLMKHEADH